MGSNTVASERRAEEACLLLDKLAAAAPTEAGQPGKLLHLEGLPGQDYFLGLVDALVFLGALELSRDGLSARPVSAQAGWLLRLLSDLIDTGQPLISDWHTAGLTLTDEPGPFLGKAGNLLRALEQRRSLVLSNPAPIREVEAAIAIVPRSAGPDGLRFLLTYDADARAWQLPGGRRNDRDATPLATLFRKLRDELGLSALDRRSVLRCQELPLVTEPRHSPSYGLLTQTRFHPFLLHLEQNLDLPLEKARWLSEAHLRQGLTETGERVAAEPLLRLLDEQKLKRAELLLN